jgi:hypothetical protein
MQDAGQRRLGPQREDMRREDQAVGVSQARHLQQQPLDGELAVDWAGGCARALSRIGS